MTRPPAHPLGPGGVYSPPMKHPPALEAPPGGASLRPRLLDLYCGAGGAAMGYARAGFEVVGVDIEPQPRYPFEFHQGDALTFPLDGFDAIHASPPCQAYSRLRHLPWVKAKAGAYWDSIPPTRELLLASGLPWVMENVGDAPLDGITLCGCMFAMTLPDGRPLYRRRIFETSWFLLAPGHGRHHRTMVAGKMLGQRAKVNANAAAMGVEWMSRDEAGQAIPPAYTEWIGEQLLAHLQRSKPKPPLLIQEVLWESP